MITAKILQASPSSRRKRLLSCAILLFLTLFAPQSGIAHELGFSSTLVLLKSDGTFQVDFRCDLDALALGAAPDADSAALAAHLQTLSDDELSKALDRLRSTLERRIKLRFDDERVRATVSFPEHGMARAATADPPTFLGLTARFEGEIPAEATTFTLAASRSFPPVHLTVLDQGSLSGTRQVLERGAVSEPVRLGEKADAESSITVATRYLVLGFEHILPAGLDHILFVLGLFLLSLRWRPLLWQVSAFTVAHTITLLLSTYGVVTLPAGIVEPLIALSIAYVAIENLFVRELKPWRIALVFAFGLLHGLGFAGVLAELGLPRDAFLSALLAFNIGVELGQVSVLALAFLALGWWRERPWFRTRVVTGLSLVIAGVGLYWFVVRLL